MITRIFNEPKFYERQEKMIRGKLMRSNRPQAKFHLKSYLNRLLIDFFDPKSKSL